MTSLPMLINEAKRAVMLAETPAEHEVIDKMLGELAAMGGYEDANNIQMHQIAEARIDNFVAMGDKLDGLRDAGVIHHGHN